MKENSPICARLAEIVSAVRDRMAERDARSAKAASDLPTTMMNSVASTGSGSLDQDRRIEQHADRDEEQHGEGVAQRQRSSAARWLSSDSLRIMPAKKAPSANDTPNSFAAPKATPSAIASTARRNSSREPVCAT